MIDKGMDRFLMALFSAGGITILIFAWLQPMPVSERILTTFIGAIGLLWVLIRVLLLNDLPPEKESSFNVRLELRKGNATVRKTYNGNN